MVKGFKHVPLMPPGAGLMGSPSEEALWRFLRTLHKLKLADYYQRVHVHDCLMWQWRQNDAG